MIRDATSKSDDYLIWPKIRHILSHWGYELTENIFLTSWPINMQKWVITGLIGKKSCKKQKENIPKKSIMHKAKKL